MKNSRFFPGKVISSVLFSLLLTGTKTLFAQPYFESLRLVSKGSQVRQILPIGNNKILIAGQATVIAAYDVFIMLADTNGIPFWTKTYGGGPFDEWNPEVIILPDSGYLVSLVSYSFGLGDGDIELMRLDKNGNLLWAKDFGGDNLEYGGDNAEFPPSAICLENGDLFVTGSTASYGAGDFDAFIFRTDSNGILEWAYQLGDSMSDGIADIVLCEDSSIAFTGFAYANAFQSEILIGKMDTGANVLWTYSIPDSFSGKGLRILEDDKQQLHILADRQFSGFNNQPAILKLDSVGNLLSAHQFYFGGKLQIYNFIFDGNGGYVFSGSRKQSGDFESVIIHVDSAGNVTNTIAMPHSGNEGIPVVQMIREGEYLALGSETDSFPTPRQFFYTLRFHEGDSLCQGTTFPDTAKSYTPVLLSRSFARSSIAIDTLTVSPFVKSYSPKDSIICLLDCFADAAYTLTDPAPCSEKPFTASSVNQDMRFHNWYFNSALYATTPDFSHTVNTAGFYPLMHIVSNGICSDTIRDTLEIRPSPVSDFSHADSLMQVFCTSLSTGTMLSYSWDFGDSTALDTSANPTHTYTSAGTFNICLTVTNSSGCTDTSCQSINIRSVGLDETISNSYSVYPNPADNFLYVHLLKKSIGNGQLYDVFGRSILTFDFDRQSGTIIVPVNDVPSGIYFLDIEMNGRKNCNKIQILH